MPESSKFDLRRPRPPAAPPPAGAKARRPGTPFAGFLAPGEVISEEHLTPYERDQYRKLGLEPGTPVPGNLADILQGIREEADPSHGLGLPSDFQVQQSEVIDVARLSPQQQRRVHEVIDQAAEQAARIADIPVIPDAGPGVNEAIAAAELGDIAAGKIVNNPRSNVFVQRGRVDEMTPEVEAHFRQVITGPAPTQAKVQAPTQAKVQAPTQAQVSQAAPQAAPQVEMATAAGTARYCRHCGWDQTLPDSIAVADGDKDGLLWSILGGPEKRFTKQIELLGGNVVVEFRTLTSRESDLALQQVSHDYRAGRISGDVNWFQRWMDYRLAGALASITLAGRRGKVYVGPDSLDDVDYDRPRDEQGRELPGTPLPALWEHIESNHLCNESLRRAVTLAYAGFVDLVKKMEDNYSNPDFWRGIGSPA